MSTIWWISSHVEECGLVSSPMINIFLGHQTSWKIFRNNIQSITLATSIVYTGYILRINIYIYIGRKIYANALILGIISQRYNIEIGTTTTPGGAILSHAKSFSIHSGTRAHITTSNVAQKSSVKKCAWTRKQLWYTRVWKCNTLDY